MRAQGLICVVTDRTRLAPSEPLTQQLRSLVRQARAAAVAGADLLQIREPGLPDALLYRLVEDCREQTLDSSMAIVVNDRLDIALAAGADGVHLKESSIPILEARRLAPEHFLVSVSVHDPKAAGVASRAGADFVIFGTMFPTASKAHGHVTASLEGLAAAVAASTVPVLAIGGIDHRHVADVARVAAGVAAIGWFATTDERRLTDVVRQARSSFDSA